MYQRSDSTISEENWTKQSTPQNAPTTSQNFVLHDDNQPTSSAPKNDVVQKRESPKLASTNMAIIWVKVIH